MVCGVAHGYNRSHSSPLATVEPRLKAAWSWSLGHRLSFQHFDPKSKGTVWMDPEQYTRLLSTGEKQCPRIIGISGFALLATARSLQR